MTIAVIGCLFVGVFQDFVGLVGLFELRFGFGIVGVAVGVQLFRLCAIALFDLVGDAPLATPRTRNSHVLPWIIPPSERKGRPV